MTPSRKIHRSGFQVDFGLVGVIMREWGSGQPIPDPHSLIPNLNNTMKRLLYRIQLRQLLLALVGTFLLQIVLLPIVSGLLTSYLQIQFGQGGNLPWLIVVLLVITRVVGLGFLLLALWERPKSLSVPSQRPPRYPGLIVIVGRRGMRGLDEDQLSHNRSIEYHLDEGNPRGEKLRVCWLIASEGESGSVNVANAVQKRYAPSCRVEVHTVDDAFHVQDTYDVVKNIYDHEATKYQLNPEQILADFTGGTTPMSVGLALAAQGYPMQYMYGGRPDIKTEPIAIQLR